ncbi:XRE family transcriptional regulator [Hungatella hathewayi]|uniref:helix-turn-helix domain-containing protein n=1 Tax=Anaerostipes faecis TaxID=2880702 RepID=UPI000EDF7C83|nr:helix-turn-helix transcriptional regulator [Anaerostipes faecis]RGC79763.1 XRE family transcriptional regulator [Hungatella hathewayi]
MNIVIFINRLRECRLRKFSSQQAFADAYMEKYGMIRTGKKTTDHNMFGTIQSWEQGKSTPTADVLANICELLDCDADYLLGRINQRTHDITNAHRYTGLSPEALEQLHEYREILASEPNWEEIVNLEENWTTHKYYKAFGLYLIDELLTGSANHKLSAGVLDNLFKMIYEEGVGVNKDDYKDEDETEYPSTEQERELWAAQCRERIDIAVFHLTSNIRDILYENTVNEKLPLALKVDKSNGTYRYSIYKD